MTSLQRFAEDRLRVLCENKGVPYESAVAVLRRLHVAMPQGRETAEVDGISWTSPVSLGRHLARRHEPFHHNLEDVIWGFLS